VPFLLFTGHYPPDQTTAAGYLADIANEIARDRPVVVFSGSGGAATLAQRPNVTVMEIGRGGQSKWGMPGRLWRMLGLSVRGFFAALHHAGPGSPVLVVTAPFLLPYFIVLAANLRGARCALLVYDLYPEAMIIAGVSKEKSLIVRTIRFFNRLMLRHLDYVITIGRDMEPRLCAYRGFSSNKIVYIPNWATEQPIFRPIAPSNPFRKSVGARFIVGMSGNLGLTHDPITPIEAAARLANNSQIHFLLSGWGPGWRRLREAYERISPPNVTLVERVPESELTDFLAAADVWLLPYRRGMAGVSVPSRTYNILAIGRPIIAISDANSEQAMIVGEDGVGWVCPPEQPQKLAELIESISADPADTTDKGKQAVATVKSRYILPVAGASYRKLADRLFSPEPKSI
jgi:glycosyltransferase involved in cell wall biosynthesis